jgi:hypothetical protein
LKGVIPKPSGSLQSVDVKIPIRHTAGTLTLREFDNGGNEGTPVSLAVGVPLSAGDPYTISESGTPGPGLTTGGSSIGLTGDDRYADFALPFSFPFFGQNFTELTVSTNGALYFDDPPVRTGLDPGNLDIADDPPGSPRALGGHKMIAGLWEDLNLSTSERADAGVFVVTSPGKIIFRWQGVPCAFDGEQCTGGANVNFEIELNSNGVIKSRYGAADPDLVPTVGIGGGEQDGYIVASHTSLDEQTAKNLSNAAEVTYTPRAASTSTIQLESAAINVNESNGFVNINATRTGDLSGFSSVNYTTSDTAGLTNCTVANDKASERCDYETTAGTLRFETGESTKTITIPIVNDLLVEGNETFTLALSSVTALPWVLLTPRYRSSITTPHPPTQTRLILFRSLSRSSTSTSWAGCLMRRDFRIGLTHCRAVRNGGFGEFDNPAAIACTCLPGSSCPSNFRARLLRLSLLRSRTGSAPTYAEFVPDMALVGGPQSPESEVLSKATYTEAWTQRPQFKARYDALSNSAYVNALEANAEVTVANKAALIAALDNAQLTRGEVLRNIVESQAVADKFFNRAFVSMQYFGYLRRDPDSIGFQNWVDTLNADPSNFRHMIFGFLFSTEYRQRFGP